MKAQFAQPTTKSSFAADVRTFGLDGAVRLALVDGIAPQEVADWAEEVVHAPARAAEQARNERAAKAQQRIRATRAPFNAVEWLS